MNDLVLCEADVVLLIACSLVIPIAIHGVFFRKRAITRRTVLVMASCLIALSGVDVVPLQSLLQSAGPAALLLDDRLFSGEQSVALYLFPAVLAGIGVNLVSHVLIGHPGKAERRFQREYAGF